MAAILFLPQCGNLGDYIVTTGCIWVCHSDQLKYRQWPQSDKHGYRHRENFSCFTGPKINFLQF